MRYLSKCNVATRTEAKQLVFGGHVSVNGNVCRDGARRISPGRDHVELRGEQVVPLEASEFVWYAMNKPRGVMVTTSDPEGRKTVMDLLPPDCPRGLAPVGRLDKASAGLLLLTNDSEASAYLLEPTNHVTKVYRVKVRGIPSDNTLRAWRHDTLHLDGLQLGPMGVEIEKRGPKSVWLQITLTEGKNRQIRRRIEAAGHSVEHLIRIAFGSLALGDMTPGSARVLSEDEVHGLMRRRG